MSSFRSMQEFLSSFGGGSAQTAPGVFAHGDESPLEGESDTFIIRMAVLSGQGGRTTFAEPRNIGRAPQGYTDLVNLLEAITAPKETTVPFPYISASLRQPASDAEARPGFSPDVGSSAHFRYHLPSITALSQNIGPKDATIHQEHSHTTNEFGDSCVYTTQLSYGGVPLEEIEKQDLVAPVALPSSRPRPQSSLAVVTVGDTRLSVPTCTTVDYVPVRGTSNTLDTIVHRKKYLYEDATMITPTDSEI